MRSGIIVCAISAVAGSASAQLQVFTDRGAWEAALGGAATFTEDFNGVAPQLIGDETMAGSLDTGLITIGIDPNGTTATPTDLLIAPGSAFGNIDGTNFVDGFTGANAGEPSAIFNVDFNGLSAFAFGADFRSPGSGSGIKLVVGNDEASLLSIGGSQSFFGVIASSNFEGFKIERDGSSGVFGEVWSADNFTFAVPAPASAALLGLGALAGVRRRR